MMVIQSSRAAQAPHADLLDPPLVHEAIVRLIAQHEMLTTEDERPLAPARGIITAVLLSVPLWALIIWGLHALF